MPELMDELKGLLLAPRMTPILESLLRTVEEGDWSVSDEVLGVGEKTFSSNDLSKYVELKNDGIRIKLYEDTNLSEGIYLKFSELPKLINNEYSGGSFMIEAYANKNGKEYVAFIDHQCRTGGQAGFEGAVFLVGNVLNMIKNEKGYRAYFQVMAHTLNALKKAEKEIGITDSPLRNIYYDLYKQDTVECIEYLLQQNLDDLQEWSGWYGLGATLVNLLNIDLKGNEKEELTELLSHQKLLPYYKQILGSGEFSFNRTGQQGMENMINTIILGFNYKNREMLNCSNLRTYINLAEKLKLVYPNFSFDKENIITVFPNIIDKAMSFGRFNGFIGNGITEYLLSDGKRIFKAIIDSQGVIRNESKLYDLSKNNNEDIIKSLKNCSPEFYGLFKEYPETLIAEALLSFSPENSEYLSFKEHVENFKDSIIFEESEKKRELQNVILQVVHPISREYESYKKAKLKSETGHFLPTPVENDAGKKLVTLEELKKMARDKVKIFDNEYIIQEEEKKLQEELFIKFKEDQRQFYSLMEDAKIRALALKARA